MRELRHFVLAALLLSGCVTARIDYSVGNVRPVSSQFASSTVSVSRFQDMRYEDKRSVSTHATRLGAFNKGTQFTADMKGFDEVFAKVKPTADDSYYVAPDRLYWKPDGPLPDMRVKLAEHLYKARVFRAAYVNDSKRDYRLDVRVNRFLSLKERHPFADGLGFLGISSLFSGNEIISAKVEWSLVETKTGAVVKSGIVDLSQVERHNNFRARFKPFKMNNAAARLVFDEIVKELTR